MISSYEEVRRHQRDVERQLTPIVQVLSRAILEQVIAVMIDRLDALDADGVDREPEGDDEIVSEDDGVVVDLKFVGRQWA